MVPAAVAVLLAGAAACSSGSPQPTPTPSQSAGGAHEQNSERFVQAPAMLAQCAFSHGATALLRSAEQYNRKLPSGQRWLQGTTMTLTFANGGGFTDWFENGGGAGFAFGGRPLGEWPEWAANHDQLPAQVCGAVVSGAAARQLHDQVYAHVPSTLKDDPWG
jgi:hypothetical protein